MNKEKKILKYLKNFLKEIGTGCRFLMIILILSLPIICLSIFDNSLDATGNLVTLRTIFSSITGYILEKSTCDVNCENTFIKNKTVIVGIFAIISTLVVILAYFLDSNVNNPSLILIKNLLFSSVGFLISASDKKTK